MKTWLVGLFCSLMAIPAQAAGERSVGVETIDSSSSTLITIYLPLPLPGGQLQDLNSIDFNQPWPVRFLISDGALVNAFIIVDARPGSALSQVVDELARRVLAQGGDPIEVLRTFIGTYLAPAPAGAHEGLPANWATPAAPPEFAQAANLAVGHYPLVTALQQPTMNLEDFFSLRIGNCVPKSLLTSLILRRLGIPNRVRAGSTQEGGHMWVELADGRHLDPTWEVVGLPDTNGAWPGWFHFSTSYLFVDQVYPITVD